MFVEVSLGQQREETPNSPAFCKNVSHSGLRDSGADFHTFVLFSSVQPNIVLTDVSFGDINGLRSLSDADLIMASHKGTSPHILVLAELLFQPVDRV